MTDMSLTRCMECGSDITTTGGILHFPGCGKRDLSVSSTFAPAASSPSPAEPPSGTRGKLLIGAARLLREAADQFVCDGRPALARKYRAAADALMRRERPGGPEFLTPESGETAVLSREDRGWIVEHCEEMQHYTKNWLVAEQARIILAYERTLNAALLASPAPPEGGCDHLWIAGPTPTTTGQRRAFTCSKCRLTRSEII